MTLEYELNDNDIIPNEDELTNLGRFPKVRTSRPDHGRTGHFENEIGFFQEFLTKNYFLRAHYLAFD